MDQVNKDKWSLDDYRKHFNIQAPAGAKVLPPGMKKEKVLPPPKVDGIQPKNGQTEKYGNTKVRIDGILFDSIKEGNYYLKLKFRLEEKSIERFEVHKRYKFILNGVLICTLTVDFNVIHLGGVEEVIDVKSAATKKKKDYVIRKKMLKAFFRIDLVEA